MESFVVCQQFKGSPYLNLPLDIGGYVNIEDYVSRALQANRTTDTAAAAAAAQDKEQLSKDAKVLRASIPFIACGDLSGWSRPDGSSVPFILDADKSYPMTLSEHIAAPIAPPIEPPYQSSIAKRKLDNQRKNI